MKSGLAAVFAAVAASACCLGPVVFTAVGSGALAVASTKLAAVRPVFLALTVLLLATGFYRTYRGGSGRGDCVDGTCAPGANRKARVVLWLVTVVVLLLAAFPYYSAYLF